MSEIPAEQVEQGEPEPIVYPEVPSEGAMAVALDQAVREYRQEPQEPVSRPKPALSAEQDRFIAQALYRADVDPGAFRVTHDPREFLRGDGSLDETRLAAAIVATAHTINEGR